MITFCRRCGPLTLFVFSAALVTAGCASLPQDYIPTQTGSLGPPTEANGLQLSIEGPDKEIPVGETLEIKARAVNVSNDEMLLPREPRLLIIWTLPDGTRDNLIREWPDEHHFRRQETVRVVPGEELIFTQSIDTQHFPGPGIVEFRAIYSVEKNTNRSLPDFWQGRLVSNAYGVEFVPSGAR